MPDSDASPADEPDGGADGADGTDEPTTEELRERVEERYDFEDFGPADMAEMEPEEWEAAFDPDTWITGDELLDRVEADLKRRVLDRDVFARVERFDGVVVAYTEDEYAAVYPDGHVEGVGTVLRDVKPTVALCSMESYDAPDAPEGPVLPEPREIPESSDTFGNTVLQVVGGVQVLAGLALLAASLLYLTGVLTGPGPASGINLIVLVVAGLGFLGVGVFMFVVVANARLSDRFRSATYRERLRGVGLADGERPAFLAEIDGVDAPFGEGRPGGDDGADQRPGGPGDPPGDASRGGDDRA